VGVGEVEIGEGVLDREVVVPLDVTDAR